MRRRVFLFPVRRPGRLSLPNMFAAGARYGFGRLLLGQLLFADGARFSHHVHHGVNSWAESLDAGSLQLHSFVSRVRRTIQVDATKPGPSRLIKNAHVTARFVPCQLLGAHPSRAKLPQLFPEMFSIAQIRFGLRHTVDPVSPEVPPHDHALRRQQLGFDCRTDQHRNG